MLEMGLAGVKEQVMVMSSPLATSYSCCGIETCKLLQQGSTEIKRYMKDVKSLIFGCVFTKWLTTAMWYWGREKDCNGLI